LLSLPNRIAVPYWLDPANNTEKIASVFFSMTGMPND